MTRRSAVDHHGQVAIVDYEPRYAEAFRTLNEEWILANFTMEDADRQLLGDPDGEIVAKGGRILMALLDGEPIGTCALVVMQDSEYDFELVKMAVSPGARGRGVGRMLAGAALELARSLGSRGVYLETSTRLEPAIALYRSLGFQQVAGHETPYARCDFQMGIRFADPDADHGA